MPHPMSPDAPGAPPPPAAQASPRWPGLRQQAQARLEQTGATGGPLPDAPPDLPRLLEELRTHQVELEIQNEELRRTQFEAELASSRYQLLFEYMPQPAMVMDEHALLHELNQTAREWLGLGPDNRNMLQANALLHALSLTGRTQLLRALRTPEAGLAQCLGDLNLTTHDQQQHHIDIHLLSLPLAYHSDARFLALLVDRTPEKQRAQERHLYQSLLDSSHDLIYATDLQGGLMLANRAVRELLKLQPDQALGTRRETVMPLRDAIEQDATDQQVLRTGRPVNTYEELHGQPGTPVQVYMTN